MVVMKDMRGQREKVTGHSAKQKGRQKMTGRAKMAGWNTLSFRRNKNTVTGVMICDVCFELFQVEF